MSDTNVILTNVRLSFLRVFQPNNDGKYTATVLIPKTDKKNYEAACKAAEAAKAAGAAKFGAKWPKRPKVTLYDGDDVQPSGKEWGPECAGHWVLRTSSKTQPDVVDRRCQPILNASEVYSGMFANIDVNFFPYSGETATGVACGLNNIQKVRDGEPLSGRASAKAVFSVLEDEDDDDFGL